jgi:type IV pilus assembly protein PilN
MSNINLLPWREELRKVRNRFFFGLLGASILGGLILILLAHALLESMIDTENKNIAYIQNEQTKISEQIKEIKGLQTSKNDLLHRMEVIQSLQADRGLIVHLLDTLPRIMPDGIYLASIKRIGQQVTLTGVSQTNTPIAVLLKNFEDPQWHQMFENVKLNEIALNTNGQGLLFVIEFTLQNPIEG